jgi:hypothetical protein
VPFRPASWPTLVDSRNTNDLLPDGQSEPVYLVGRGMQLLTRIERTSGSNEIQLERTRWLYAHRAELQDVVNGILQSPSPAVP